MGGPELLGNAIRCRPPLPQPLRHVAQKLGNLRLEGSYASPAFHIHPVGLAMNAVLQGNVDFTVISESTVEGFLSSEFVLALPPGF